MNSNKQKEEEKDLDLIDICCVVIIISCLSYYLINYLICTIFHISKFSLLEITLILIGICGIKIFYRLIKEI